ncbi:MAG: hypothetical protein ACD_13C00134G0045 [uncultured bacterium]|uniref:Uncharacterized protein n=1 Tax=Candidatus Woesebacteria bacterium GW2011_GWA1_40_43 TaxID=1618553 RepID=A0A0G0SGV8_9BACT|nr:MAG: hypothetical protein ACD_13C00134G0045 [uncultured bacterium]KKR52175.1 MAG: hypothetical protein UT88_C0024G0010 [Candidatus Woesebacteria bacterium GW2011_GWD2_40_19]KKR57620.1 MAG: hypothetical protein UT96_C0016G0005 [Candidatus Woesebacteria bacterium GW2011_GWC2_40_30]KKR64049.1 MAG: hypothetical protein UU02_C0013G0007 [Candidatus Woesebacteria bacterium GW2011_GWA1_40_43]HAU65461.1 hypothetical protein [Candidatus Woesebacteria bacterium]
MDKIFGKHQKNKVLRITLFFGIILIVAIGAFRFFNLKNFIGDKIGSFSKKSSEIQNTNTEKSKTASCTRTTRLENKPQYDRALSLIAERYEVWEKSPGLNTFPSQLTNCIKIVESDVRASQKVEGYFEFNGEEIKDNYFPIYVDKDYSYSDDIVNALLLVHEITHVRQYLDLLNGKDNLSCIDKEVEAFFGEWEFSRFQGDETNKSIDLRIKYDEDLNPQLQIIKSINNYIVSQKFVGLVELCKDESSNNPCSKIIDDHQKQMIKEIVVSDDYYQKQCELQ